MKIANATKQSVERRKSTRYRMDAGAIFRWKGSRSHPLQGEGKTRDISLTGIYIFTATCPPVGSIIHVDVQMPRLFDTSSREIKAEMKVLRVEPAAGSERPSGFSAVSKGFKLCVSSD